MKPGRFDLHRPTTVDEAVDILSRYNDRGEEAKPIAGGQSLVPMMNFRLARPSHLVDLAGIDELHRIEAGPDRLVIGAMVTQRACLEEPAIEAWSPPLVEAVRHIGHGHIRNRGTVGGSIAHADPAAELPAALVALDGEVEITGPYGRRLVAADDFFDGWFTTGLGESEVLTAVHLPPLDVGGRPVLSPGSSGVSSIEWGFEELARRQGDFAMVLAATVVRRGADGTIADARIVLGGVGPTPVRAVAAERLLVGSTGSERFDEAAAASRAACSPSSDAHADATYRSEMVEVVVRRSLRGARVNTGARRDVGRAPAPAARVATAGALDRPVAPGPAFVNGEDRDLDDVPDRLLLADWLRNDLGLTGTHLGCEHGVCGACTVLIDDRPVRSCLVFARQVEGRSVTTIEYLGTPDRLHPIQEAFRAHHGLQCGFCTPGMVLAAVDLLRRHPDPDGDRIREELSGNLCRCTGYVKIIEAVRAAAVELRARSSGRSGHEAPGQPPNEPPRQPPY